MRVAGMGWAVAVLLTCGGSVARAYDADVPLFMQAPDLGPEVEAVLKGVHLDPARLKGVILAAPVTVPLPPVPAGLGPILLDPPKQSAEARPVGLPPLAGGPAAPDLDVPLALLRLSRGDDAREVLDVLRRLPRATLLARLAQLRPGERPVASADGLVTVLVEEQHVRVDALDGAPPRLRQHVAGWLARRGEARCVALLEALLAERTARLGTAVLEVELLADYHRRCGQPREAADVWLGAGRYTTNAEVLGNYTVEAARALRQAGDADAAAALFDRVASRGYGWATGLFCYDQAQWLVSRRDYAGALAALDRPVTGRCAEQIKVALTVLRGEVLLRQGRSDEAREQFADALAQAQRVGKLLAGEGLEGVLATARARLAAGQGGGR